VGKAQTVERILMRPTAPVGGHKQFIRSGLFLDEAAYVGPRIHQVAGRSTGNRESPIRWFTAVASVALALFTGCSQGDEVARLAKAYGVPRSVIVEFVDDVVRGTRVAHDDVVRGMLDDIAARQTTDPMIARTLTSLGRQAAPAPIQFRAAQGNTQINSALTSIACEVAIDIATDAIVTGTLPSERDISIKVMAAAIVRDLPELDGVIAAKEVYDQVLGGTDPQALIAMIRAKAFQRQNC
jgi:hypothetical protein